MIVKKPNSRQEMTIFHAEAFDNAFDAIGRKGLLICKLRIN